MSKWLNSLFKAGVLSWALSLTADCMGADRILRAQDMTVARGETNTLLISLESLGDENALGMQAVGHLATEHQCSKTQSQPDPSRGRQRQA